MTLTQDFIQYLFIALYFPCIVGNAGSLSSLIIANFMQGHSDVIDGSQRLIYALKCIFLSNSF